MQENEIVADRSDAEKRISMEANRLAVDVLFSEKGHFNASNYWRKVYLWLGIPTAVLAGIAGVSFLGNSEGFVPSLVAFGAAILSAIATFLNPQERADRHQAAGARYGSLRRNLRSFIQIDTYGNDGAATLNERLQQLTKEVNEAQLQAPSIPYNAWVSGKKTLDKGSADYTENELEMALGQPRK